MNFGRAVLEDIEGIQQVAKQSWEATYQHIFSPEFIQQFLAAAYSTPNLTYDIQHEDHFFEVAKENGLVVGYCQLGDRGEGMELFRIYLLPQHWGKGIGAVFLEHVETWLHQQGNREYFCYVHAQNSIGKAFYHKQGFRHVPERDDENEWCMVKQVT